MSVPAQRTKDTKDIEKERDRWKNSAEKVTKWLEDAEAKNRELEQENDRLRSELEWLAGRLYNYANHVDRINPSEIAKDIRAIASESERSVL